MDQIGEGIFCNTPSTNNNTWYHIVVNYTSSDNNYAIYVNGILQGSKIMTSSFQDTVVNIGNSTFNGKIDDVRIFNRVLTPEEISTLYHEGGW